MVIEWPAAAEKTTGTEEAVRAAGERRWAAAWDGREVHAGNTVVNWGGGAIANCTLLLLCGTLHLASGVSAFAFFGSSLLLAFAAELAAEFGLLFLEVSPVFHEGLDFLAQGLLVVDDVGWFVDAVGGGVFGFLDLLFGVFELVFCDGLVGVVQPVQEVLSCDGELGVSQLVVVWQ